MKNSNDNVQSRMKDSERGGQREQDQHQQGEQSGGAPSPDAVLPGLNEQQRGILRRIGQEWDRTCSDPGTWKRSLPVDLGLGSYPDAMDIRPKGMGRFVRISMLNGQPSDVEMTREAGAPSSAVGRIGYNIRRILLGEPLKSSAVARERMSKIVALPVLSADALSSIAYGPEAMLAVLMLGSSAAYGYALPIAAVIAFLMLAVGLSYRQTIRAYPHGGGSYIVASDNLGRLPGLIAAAGLLVDYILTVAVSVSSGVAAITSAVPSLVPATVPIGVGVILVLLAGNLRGVRQAGFLFALPTYLFIFVIITLIGVGLFEATGRGFHPLPLPPLPVTEGLSVLLLLRAFSSGSTAMTGIEAVSNAVPAFKPVEWQNARTTLSWMIALLILLFAGIMALIHLDGVVPVANQTILSELAHRSFGSGFLYIFTQAATAAILLLAANTAYNDFPRVLFLLAHDNYAPRPFLRIGDRLAFSNGILVLSVAAIVIYVVFGGQTTPLIPLFAVGVFLAFTLSQAGMVVHWWRRRDAFWRRSLFFNATGCALSAIVFITAAITKFVDGAWVALFTAGLFVLIALRIRRYYDHVNAALALRPDSIELPQHRVAPGKSAGDGQVAYAVKEGEVENGGEETPAEIHHLIIVPIASLDRASMRALAYAASLQQPVFALHLSPTEEEAKRFRDYWHLWGDHLPLKVIVSPYRALVAPMVHYIEALHQQRADLTLTIILPEIIVRHWWHCLLHSQTAARLRSALRHLPRVVITSIPFHLPG